MPKFTSAYDDSPALTAGQKKLPDAVQKAIAKKKLRAIIDKEKEASIAAAALPAALGAVSGEDPIRGAASSDDAIFFSFFNELEKISARVPRPPPRYQYASHRDYFAALAESKAKLNAKRVKAMKADLRLKQISKLLKSQE